MSNQPNQPVAEKETPYAHEDMDPETKFYWEVLARLRGKASDDAKTYLSGRDGAVCFHCKVPTGLSLLEFHHLDRNIKENHRWNLRLVHHPCNTKIYHTEQKGQPAFTVRKVRERETGGMPSQALDESKPTTVALNEEYEENYRRYVITRVLAYGADPDPDDMVFLIRKNLHAAACEWTGCNPKTGYPYLARMTNPENGFITESPWRKTGRKILVFKRPEYYSIQSDDIMRMHPKEGLRMAAEQTWPRR